MRPLLVVFLVALLGAGASCPRAGEAADMPTLHMDAKPLEAATVARRGCVDAEKVQRIKGSVPQGAIPLIEMTVKADRAVPFWMFEQALTERSSQHCCTGVSVLKAEAEPGEALFHEVTAVGWWRETPAKGE
jgi:hypothetical protein